tara:strand:+ start:876 stop:2153 length:1278 start_codon:yes stop_codon:yes gene_type:complete
MSKPVFVISCPFDTYSGYGARSRDIAKAIIELDEYDVKLLPQRWGDTPGGFCMDHPEWHFLFKHQIMKLDGKPDIWMQITIPNEFQQVGKYNIGCTAGIESTGCDVTWVQGVNRMNMTWTSSKHSKGVFESLKFEQKDKRTNTVQAIIKCEKPIHVVFEGVNLDVYKHLPNKKDIKLDLNSIKEQFNFLFVGHWMNGDIGHDRKNVGAMIRYFYDTFKNKPSQPGLILKASMGRNSYYGREQILKKLKKIKQTYPIGTKFPSIYLLNGNLTDEDMNELYNHPKVKCMLSMTKGEGYGRPLAEFGLSKKPIVASGWSGQIDFLHPEYTTLLPGNLEKVHPSAANNWLKQEYEWFQVSYKHFCNAMKSVKQKYNKFITGGKRQGHHIKTNFSYDAMKDLVGNILKHNIPEFPKEVELSLPTLETPKL